MVLGIRAYGRRVLDDLEVGISAAWHGEDFARARRLPDLEKVLAKRSRRAIDRAFTARETLRWTQELAKKKEQATTS